LLLRTSLAARLTGAATFTGTLAAACGSAATQGALLGDQIVQLPLLELLGEGAQRKAEHGHGGAEAEGLLQGQ